MVVSFAAWLSRANRSLMSDDERTIRSKRVCALDGWP
jgi:hypothetical protein